MTLPAKRPAHIEFLILVDGLDVLADVLFGSPEEIRDLLLGQPDRAILEMQPEPAAGS